MNKNNASIRRWAVGVVYVGVIALLLACSVLTSAPDIEEGTLRLREGTVEVLDDKGEWTPVAGAATFELTGELESTDPWVVAGTTVATNELTQIAEGLEVGDLVRVRGTILEDGTWVAYSIEPAEEQTEPVIVLIGVVDSVDPWVVDGIELNVTENTEIQGEIKVGMLVRAEIMLLPDGTWEVIRIAPLGDSTETPGCVTVVATVVSVEGDEILFLGWPTPVTFGEGDKDVGESGGEEDDEEGEDEDESGDEDNGEGVVINPGDVVRAVVCVTDDGQIVIVQILVLDTDEDNGDTGGGNEKVLVCHNASKNNPHTISIAQPAVPAHLAHGDTLGACP